MQFPHLYGGTRLDAAVHAAAASRACCTGRTGRRCSRCGAGHRSRSSRCRRSSSSSPCRRCGHRCSRRSTSSRTRCSPRCSGSPTAPRGVGRLPPARGEAAGRARVDPLVDGAAEHGPPARRRVAGPADGRVGRLRAQRVRLGVGGQRGSGHGGADEEPAPAHRAEPLREPRHRTHETPTPGGDLLESVHAHDMSPRLTIVARSVTRKPRTTCAARGTVAIRREWLPMTVNRQNARPRS